MKIVDNIKGKVKNILTEDAAKMQICMLGARGVGKTSVLTSMFHNLNEKNSESNLMLVTSDKDNGWTSKAIVNKFKQLNNAFLSAKTSEYLTDFGIEGDYEIHTYRFRFGIKGKNNRIDLDVRDYPGEYIDTHPDDVKAYIDESNAVIIAIDTPYVMECEGVYNEVKNRPSDVTSFIKKSFSDLQADKLILFVPLKCEKYYKDGKINDVTARVEEVYADLLNFFKTCESKKHIACAITPILTLGDVVFDSFEKDDDGNITLVIDDHGDSMPIAKYKYISPEATYNAKYCEQPLCYLLAFVTKLYYRTKDTKSLGFLGRMTKLLKLFPDDPILLMEANKFALKKVIDRDGYKIIQGRYKV